MIGFCELFNAPLVLSDPKGAWIGIYGGDILRKEAERAEREGIDPSYAANLRKQAARIDSGKGVYFNGGIGRDSTGVPAKRAQS